MDIKNVHVVVHVRHENDGNALSAVDERFMCSALNTHRHRGITTPEHANRKRILYNRTFLDLTHTCPTISCEPDG